MKQLLLHVTLGMACALFLHGCDAVDIGSELIISTEDDTTFACAGQLMIVTVFAAEEASGSEYEVHCKAGSFDGGATSTTATIVGGRGAVQWYPPSTPGDVMLWATGPGSARSQPTKVVVVALPHMTVESVPEVVETGKIYRITLRAQPEVASVPATLTVAGGELLDGAHATLWVTSLPLRFNSENQVTIVVRASSPAGGMMVLGVEQCDGNPFNAVIPYRP